MDTNNQITKEKVKEVMKTSHKGCEIAKVLKEYFAAHCKPITATIEIAPRPNENVTDFAMRLFGPVETPGATTA